MNQPLKAIVQTCLLTALSIINVKAQTPDPANYNGTAEGYTYIDGVKFIYRMTLHFPQPVDDVSGELDVYAADNLQTPIQRFYLTEVTVAKGKMAGDVRARLRIPDDYHSQRGRYSSIIMLSYNDGSKRFTINRVYTQRHPPIDEYLNPKSHIDLTDAKLYGPDHKTVVNITYPDKPSDSILMAERKAIEARRKELREADRTWLDKHFVWILLIVWGFFGLNLPGALRAGQALPLVVVAALLSLRFDSLMPFLPALPACLIAFPLLQRSSQDGNRGSKVATVFTVTLVLSFVVMSVIAFQTQGFPAIIDVLVWIVACCFGWYIFDTHLGKSCCTHCGKYGCHTFLSSQVVSRQVRETRINKNNFNHTEVNLDKKEIIDWYKRKYGVQVDVMEILDVFYECCRCHHIFKAIKINQSSREKW